MVDFVFPEDAGTGAAGGDNADAANFATHRHASNLTDYVEAGMGFTLDAGTPALDVAAGLAFVSDASAQEAQTTETRDQGVTYAVIIDARTGVSLTDGAVNHVFLDVDLTADDTVSITTNTTGTAPAEPSLKLGEVDTSADTTDEQNRNPDGVYQSLDVEVHLSPPTFATKADLPTDGSEEEADVAYVTGESRYYHWEP